MATHAWRFACHSHGTQDSSHRLPKPGLSALNARRVAHSVTPLSPGVDVDVGEEACGESLPALQSCCGPKTALRKKRRSPKRIVVGQAASGGGNHQGNKKRF